MNLEHKSAHDFFEQNGFLPVGVDSFRLFKQFDLYSKFQEMSSVIITTWDSVAYNGLYKMIDEYLCSVYFYEGKQVYFAIHRPPNNEVKHSLKQIIDVLFNLCKDAGLPFLQIKFIDECYLNEFKTIEGYHIETEFFDDDSEYAYRIEDLLDTSGKKHLEKRKHLNKFINAANRDIEYKIIKMTNDNKYICEEIEKDWCKDRDCSYCESFSGCEKKVMDIMLKIFDENVHSGIFGYAEGKPTGYIIWEKRLDKTAFMYFGKSNTKNHYTYLIYMMAKEYFDGVEYMNINEDMGNHGLRVFKQHLAQYEHWKKYICTFNRL